LTLIKERVSVKQNLTQNYASYSVQLMALDIGFETPHSLLCTL